MTKRLGGGPTNTQGGHDPKIMSLFEHLDELRGRMIKSLLAVIVLFVVGMIFADDLIGFLKGPLLESLPKAHANLHFTSPLDVIVAEMKVAFLLALVLGCPIWIYQLWRFIEPALYPEEKKYIKPFIASSVALFFAGVIFCYTIMLPLTLDFLIGMGLNVGIPLITVGEYMSLITYLILGFGLVFETPIILIILAMMDIISAEAMVTYRRHMIVVILILAAILTPPDPISQIAMAIPMYLMYEISIVVIKFLKSKRHAT